ncbi:TonB-dependent receptor [Gallaecimonas pentaromativorans]|uniref:Iron complex outermembrane receptor protein n=1 Tax=Gallaecimonas pentaromativorans TaxID=584787 RepID=A0A3N1P211_9GAMM|nr:TonB-dependent receptor [Gallaecimonas pentaromativorans]MED5524019.1 TonB-dependent receptor [Pseudomonadota bacterium]ROQ22443.1 iron complex outermembrane receptor protein [Gallaecimonas pentaromativorans]
MNSINAKKLGFLAASVMAALQGLTPAMAADEQPKAKAASQEIETIEVTATRRVTSLRSTPVAVSAFSQDALDDNHVQQLSDLQGMVPSLHISQNGSQNTPMVYIRGIGSSDQTESGDPAVAFHVDGVYSARSQGASTLMFDLESAEILRGPQGTLFGRNATGGVVNLHTAKPRLDGFDAYLELGIGNYNKRTTRGMVNMPLADDWAVRVAVATDTADGNVNPTPGSVIGDKYGSTDMKAVRLSSLYVPSDKLSWFLSYENFIDQGSGQIPTRQGGSHPSAYIQVPGYNDYNVDSYRTRLDYHFDGGITASYIGGYTKSSRVSTWDRSWRPGNFEWGGCVDCGHKAVQHELQLQNADDSRLQWTVGYFYFKENNDVIFDIVHPDNDWDGGTGNNPNLYGTYRQPDRGLESNSLYAQGTYSLTDDWRVTLGARYTEDKRWDRGGRNIMCPQEVRTTAPLEPNTAPYDDGGLLGGLAPNKNTTAPGQCWVDTYNDASPKWDKTTGLGRIEWDFSSDVMFYASVATGFKSGTLQDGGHYNGTGPFTQSDLDAIIKANNDEHNQTAAYVAPETNTSYELGMKGDFLDSRMQLFVTLFSTRYKDLQVTSNVTSPTGADLLRKTNAGKATINGMEVESKWLVGENGKFTGSISVLDATYDDFKTTDSKYGADGTAFNPSAGNPNLPNLLDFSGNHLVNAPDFAATLEYQHYFYLKNGASLRPRVRLTYSSEIWFDPANRGDRPEGFKNEPYFADIDRQDAYAKWDTSVIYEPASGNWNLEFYIDNLTDKKIKSDQGRNFNDDVPNFMWQNPRQFGAKLKVRF